MAPSPLQGEGTSSKTNGPNRLVPRRLYRIDTPPSLTDFTKLCTQTQQPSDFSLWDVIVKNIPIYDLSKYSVSDTNTTSSLQDEWNEILRTGSGVFVLKNFVTDASLLNRVNNVFDEIISKEGLSSKGDHFAAAGKNSRIWNSFQKHALHDPDSFVEYYSNPWLALACEAWLGPAYQVTAQVNIVKPGGAPQAAHRDYHLGFQGAEQCASFPRSTQLASQLLTLQGAIAHSEMPLESGPTRFLPFSQLFEEGYMAWRLPEFKQYFEDHWVSLPLKPGDAVFFNPALFHAAGENQSQWDRSANLLQVSSAFGKPMETIDNLAIIKNCWVALKRLCNERGRDREVDACVCAIASGYPFPTNLDRRPPAPGGMAPSSEADVVFEALQGDWTTDVVVEAVRRLRLDSLA
ncbi:related to protein involved in biosynthesis of mitomycin antibiotics/polyketide fumonisin [Phialocephala subalpina]|uniref:Related to protein involved in biosynthesis of mitomycin antibiotics/polyketide fumonisin n=1 Tax=Phialocephala subalpina TaxID=576137 RepID=A0A1L7X2Z2_9HELO|nr:related to protein involved in biosynthesis of mitomycin antibiotics/polyketide fumonisin [Phialocephala subalpina]